MAQSNPTSSESARVHIWVIGRVQGVGFRAYVTYHAQKIGVTGWVRNVGYDTVEALAEGTQVQIEAFIQTVRMGPRPSQIDESRIEEETHTGEFADFQIRASR